MSNAIGTLVGVGALVIIAIAFCVICTTKKKRKKQAHNYEDPPPPEQGGQNYVYNDAQQPISERQEGLEQGYDEGPKQGYDELKVVKEVSEGTFTYDDLALATNGFAEENLIGEGGLGYVHKGVFPNGKTIAVKTLKEGGPLGLDGFKSESEAIARVHHRHLVLLLGFCIFREKRMLVYEFIPNYNLEHHLHGNLVMILLCHHSVFTLLPKSMFRGGVTGKGVPPMSWSRRMQIAIGIVKGLTYLHEDCKNNIY